MSEQMQALVIKSPEQVEVIQRPIPEPKDGMDVVVKVELTALCGSDLHIYRGHPPMKSYDFILGHEFVGEVYKVGKNVQKFQVGEKVVSPFTAQCGECFYCERGQTSRCQKSALFGSPALDGAQAEYVLVPQADSTLFHAPEGVKTDALILMADIFPTGYFVANNAWKMLNEVERKDATVAVLGCGPVGLCAITAAKTLFSHVYAIDSIAERLDAAKRHGAIPVNLNDDPAGKIRDATGGRGADAVLEVVGAPDALVLAVKLARPWGVVSSCGVHTHDVTLSGADLYNKNIRFQFGRCPVRSLFGEAMKLLAQHDELFATFIGHKVPLSEAPKYYKLFNERKVMKTAFIPGK